MSSVRNVGRLGPIGIWAIELRYGDFGQVVEATVELEEMGYPTLWFPGGQGGDITGDSDRLLRATRRVNLATGIINIWMHEPEDIAAWWLGLPEGQQQRMLLGLGVSHAELIGDAWKRPLSVMRAYLDRLDAAGLPKHASCLAALGPKMLELARDRTAGAHPYLVTPEHTAGAREILGPDALLATEQGVVLETDPAKARELARGVIGHYRTRPNYYNSWKRLGFTDEDIADMNDRIVDALFAWGTAEQIAERVREHHAAGADHVCLQVVQAPGGGARTLLPAWRELAGVLL